MWNKISRISTVIKIKKLEVPLILLGLFLFSIFLAYPLLLAKISLPSEFSTPLLPFLISSLSLFTRMPQELVLRAVVFSFYVLMPLTFFLFVKYLTKNLLFASIAAFLYNFPLPLAFILPSWRMMIMENGVLPLQALALLAEGEIQHVAGLFFLPLAAIYFLKFVRHGAPRNLVWGVLLSTALALTSRAALWAFFIFSFALTISDSLLTQGRLKIKRAIFFTVLFLGLSSFWYTPLFWGENLKLAYEMGIFRGFGILFPISFVVVPVLGVMIFLLCDHRPRRHTPLTIFLLYLFFGGTVFAGEFFGLSFAPRPERYLLELHLAASLLWGFIAVYGFNLLWRREEEVFNHRYPARMGPLAVATFLGILLFVALGGFMVRRSLFRLGGAIHLRGLTEPALPSLADRPLWDLSLGFFISLASALFLLALVTKPAYLERIFAFLPQLLGGMRRQWHRHRRRRR